MYVQLSYWIIHLCCMYQMLTTGNHLCSYCMHTLLFKKKKKNVWANSHFIVGFNSTFKKKFWNISVFRTMCHLTRIFFMPAKLQKELQNLLSLSTTYLSSLLMLVVNVHRDRNGSSALTLSRQFSFLFHLLNLTKYYWKTGQL